MELDNLLVGAYRYLIDQPVIAALVAEGLLGSDEKYPAWVFRNQNTDPGRAVGGSGTGAIVLSRGGFWSQQNKHNTAQFPTLRISIYADCSRDLAGDPKAQDAGDKCFAIYQRINPLFHDPAHQVKRLGNVRIHDMVSGAPFSVLPMYSPNGDDSAVGTATYDLSTD